MIDTFAISKTSGRPPKAAFLFEQGWKEPKYHGKFTKLVSNSEKGSGEPRLTLSLSPKCLWIIKAEVSIASWLFGSNVILPDEIQFKNGLRQLSKYVEEKSSLNFDAETERVSRADFARDFQVNESQVIPIISAIGKMTLPKYTRNSYETSVYFRNSGKIQNKHYLVYSKYHELLNKGKSLSELERARGRIRLEISHKGAAIYNLSKSLGLPNKADCILTKETSESVIDDAMNQLQIRDLLETDTFELENLFKFYNQSEAKKLTAFLALRQTYGIDFFKNPVFGYSKRICRKYMQDCIKAGVSSLE